MMSVSLCIHCWCGRFCCWWHGSQSVDLHPFVMLIHIYQRSPCCILCLYAPSLYRHGGLQIYHVTYYALDMRIYNTVLIWYLNMYNLSNITCHHHNFCVRNRSRLHINHLCPASSAASRDSHGMPFVHSSCQPGPSGNRQLHAHSTLPAASLARRATASCTPIVHPPSCQPGPSGNRQLRAHCAPAQLPAWPIGQPPAARPLCIRPAASLAHRATASCTPIVHPPSCQPGPSGNRQLHAQLTPIGHPLSCQPGPSGNRQLHARLTLSCTVNSRAAPGPPFSADASTPLPSPLELMTYQPPFPPHHRWRRNQDASV